MCITFSFKTAEAAEGDPVEFLQTSHVNIAHVTDLNYFPLSYCYSGDLTNADNDYRSDLLTGTSLFLESSQIIKTSLRRLLDLDVDYLLITGNLTYRGELLGHIEMSNYLRWLQTTVRESKSPNFQIFVIPGENDLYNEKAAKYDNQGKKVSVASITRKEFSKIYAGLGYPSLTNAEMMDFYDSLPESFPTVSALVDMNGARFINSEIASGIGLDYQYLDIEDENDYPAGYLSYSVQTTDRTNFYLADDGLTDYTGVKIGSRISREMLKFLDDFIKKDHINYSDNLLIGVFHHNVIPHFEYESTLLVDTMLYNWRSIAEYLATNNVRYVFSGSAKVNDINNYFSFSGNKQLTEITTASLNGYKCGMRELTIEQGILGNSYTENLLSRLIVVKEVNITNLFKEGYLNSTSEYFSVTGTGNYLDILADGSYVYKDASEFAATKILRNLLDSYIYTYLNPSAITDFVNMLKDVFIKNNLAEVAPYVSIFTDNLIAHLEDVVLADYYNYSTPYTLERGSKLTSYLTVLVNNILALKVGPVDSIAQLIVNSYLTFIAGNDIPQSKMPEELLNSLSILSSGTVIKNIMDQILYGTQKEDNTGLMRIIDGLIKKPINIVQGLTNESDIAMIKNAFLTLTGTDIDPNAVYFDDIITLINIISGALVDEVFNLKGVSFSKSIETTIKLYFNDNVAQELGELLSLILYSFNVDETPDGLGSQLGMKQDLILVNPGSQATYVKEISNVIVPTIENGRLPSMIAVTFGTNPKTSKNFVWFTDRLITETTIEYCEGDKFDAETATVLTGDTKIRPLTTASVDFGIYSTNLEIELARHSVALKDLKEGAVYSYRLGSKTHNYWSEISKFKTGPDDNGKFDALLISDLQGIVPGTFDKTSEMLKDLYKVFDNEYDFVINAGNITYNGQNGAQYKYFSNALGNVWANTTQVVATGQSESENFIHDSESLSALWGLSQGCDTTSYNFMELYYNIAISGNQNATKNSGIYYSFDYGPVHFVVLNTNDISSRGYVLADEQYKWLLNDLIITSKTYKVVIMNTSVYGQGLHDVDNSTDGLRRQLTQVFAEYNVSLVISGNEHAYSESHYLDKDGKPVYKDLTSGVHKLDSTSGVLYVSLGTAGNKFYDYLRNDDLPIAFTAEGQTGKMSKPTFGKLWYDGESLLFAGYEYDLNEDGHGSVALLRFIDEPDKSSVLVLLAIAISIIVAATLIAFFFLWFKKQAQKKEKERQKLKK